MPQHMVKCEICGITTQRVDNHKRLFMAKFPLDENRCRQWVRLTGKEDLAYVPIEKLHSSKHICGQHFRPRDFSKKKTQLRKKAIPSVGLTAKPLSDEILKEFPLHIAKTDRKDSQSQISREHGYCKFVMISSVRQISEINSQSQISREHGYCTFVIRSSVRQINGDENSSSRANIPQTSPSPEHLTEDNAPLTEDTLVTEDDQTNDDIETIEKETFSWQKANQICLDDEDEICENTVTTETIVKESETNIGLELKYWESEEKKSDKENSNHKEYFCNNCSKSIVGFRYTCVECENYDLCLECEMNMTHPEHCMLRIPKPSPADEIQSILEAIRDKMRSLSEELEQNQLALDEIKVEVEFDDPATTDPLTSSRAGTPLEATDVICDEVTSGVTCDEVTSGVTCDEVTSGVTCDEVTSGVTYVRGTSEIITHHIPSPIAALSVARQRAMSRSETVGRADTKIQPQAVPATKTPLVLHKKLKLTDFDENNLKWHSKRRKLSRQVEEDFERELEETWLDEDILEEDNRIFDVEEAPSGSHTSSTLKRKLNVRQAHTAEPGPS